MIYQQELLVILQTLSKGMTCINHIGGILCRTDFCL
jgi:hypothetical protein